MYGNGIISAGYAYYRPRPPLAQGAASAAPIDKPAISGNAQGVTPHLSDSGLVGRTHMLRPVALAKLHEP